MVACAAGAVKAVGVCGNAGATALGLGMGKSDMDLSRELFKQQMRQAKRLWTADWAEASVRHGETTMQAAQHHSEAQSMATASYYQAEKLASQSIKLARDQDSRAYEMAWRTEVRESLRDELGNQNNRFNIIMLCDTVCLGCVFTLVADGAPPDQTPFILLNAYVCCLGISIMMFSISLWGSVIIMRRLHDNTAARLERRLFVESEDLQKAWQQQLAKSTPTGAQEIYLVHQAYEKWVLEFIDPIGRMSIELLSIGVVTMFIAAGILIHNVYLIEYDNFVAVPIFWTCVFVTCTTMLYMKFSEDRKEKKKDGVYNVSWQGENTQKYGPFAKIDKAAEELSSSTAEALGSIERVKSFDLREKMEKDSCTNTKLLQSQVESLKKESIVRSKIRKEVLQLLTTNTEELDALPEDLISRTNEILHSIDEADECTANLVTIPCESENSYKEREKNRFSLYPQNLSSTRKGKTGAHPIDAQRLPVSLEALRKKLGGISHTTLLRLRNTSNEPLRLKSGVRLKGGKYIKFIHASDPHGNPQCFQLYPGSEIPPKTEVLVAARSRGGWVPTSGIDGKIVYTNYDKSWTFEISFRNDLIGNVRRCHVNAYPTSVTDESSSIGLNATYEQNWQITKDEYDAKANNEIAISFDVIHGRQTKAALFRHQQSTTSLKDGFMFKKIDFGIGSQWQRHWCVLTPIEIKFSEDHANEKQLKIPLQYITKVQVDPNQVTGNIFEIHTSLVGNNGVHFLSTESPRERDDWIKSILGAVEMISDFANQIITSESEDHKSEEIDAASDSFDMNLIPSQSYIEDSVECIHQEKNTEVLPV